MCVCVCERVCVRVCFSVCVCHTQHLLLGWLCWLSVGAEVPLGGSESSNSREVERLRAQLKTEEEVVSARARPGERPDRQALPLMAFAGIYDLHRESLGAF